MVQYDASWCFGDSYRYSVVQSHWHAVVSLISVFDRPGTHVAFRDTYMQRLHAFLEESDAASIRRSHRRCPPEIAARMSQTSLRDTSDRTPDVSSRPRVSRRSGSRVRILISRWPWLAHQWPRGLFALIDPRGALFGPDGFGSSENG